MPDLVQYGDTSKAGIYAGDEIIDYLKCEAEGERVLRIEKSQNVQPVPNVTKYGMFRPTKTDGGSLHL